MGIETLRLGRQVLLLTSASFCSETTCCENENSSPTTFVTKHHVRSCSHTGTTHYMAASPPQNRGKSTIHILLKSAIRARKRAQTKAQSHNWKGNFTAHHRSMPISSACPMNAGRLGGLLSRSSTMTLFVYPMICTQRGCKQATSAAAAVARDMLGWVWSSHA